MTASYAISAAACDVDHPHSHERQHVTQRPSHELRSSKAMNGGPIAPQDNTSTQIHNHSSHISNRQLEVEDECLDVTTQLPPLKLASMKAGTTRPTSMQRRISVGLPTHLRLQGKGYGVPAARKANFAPSRDATSR